MTAAREFKNKIQGWLKKNGFNGVNLRFDYDFGFAPELKTIFLGVNSAEAEALYFQEHLNARGLEVEGIWFPVLAFLHELGHFNTSDQFEEIDNTYFYILKNMISPNLSKKEELDEYWAVDDEAAANKWEIEYINSHFDAVCDLCKIYGEAWIALMSAADVFELAEQESLR